MRIASGIDFLLGKNKFQMYDELPKFSGKISVILTINAISENQAVKVHVTRRRFGSWEPGLLPLEGMSDQKSYEVFEAIPNELGSSDYPSGRLTPIAVGKSE